jgi:hypothetical protein
MLLRFSIDWPSKNACPSRASAPLRQTGRPRCRSSCARSNRTCRRAGICPLSRNTGYAREDTASKKVCVDSDTALLWVLRDVLGMTGRNGIAHWVGPARATPVGHCWLFRCQTMARLIALVYNWWTLYVRLADPDHHHEALTTRSLLLQAVARQTRHAGQTRLSVITNHGRCEHVQRALQGIAKFFSLLKQTAEQLTAPERWGLDPFRSPESISARQKIAATAVLVTGLNSYCGL